MRVQGECSEDLGGCARVSEGGQVCEEDVVRLGEGVQVVGPVQGQRG